MSYYIVDVESDGPAPGVYNMICFGVVKLTKDLRKAPTFYGQTAPVTDFYIPEVLAISGFSRADHKNFPRMKETMANFSEWIVKTNEKGRPIFVSDNPAFDWQWISHGFAYCGLDNPFGHSGRRIGDFYAGLEKDFTKQSAWKKYRVTTHDHNPINDALGNAEALVKICDEHGVILPGLT